MNDRGFTLIEALVALVIMGIAAAGLLRATEAHVDRVGGLEARAAALWVAENRLAELQLADQWPAEVDMLGRRWHISEQRAPSSDPDLVKIDIAVSEASATGSGLRGTGQPHSLVTLSGFLDTGAASNASLGAAPGAAR